MCKVLLILTGNISVNVQHTPLQETVLDAGLPKPIGPGDVIISNFGSCLNLIWLQFAYSPLFAIPVSRSEAVLHTFHSIFLCVLTKSPVTLGQKRPLSRVVQSAQEFGVPVVLFPEGAPTDGRGVARFSPIDLSGYVVHVLAFSHRSGGVSADFVSGNGVYHVFRMTGRTLAAMKVRIATPHDVGSAKGDYRALLGQLLRVPLVDISATAKPHHS
jgi:hypothetical protein